MTEYKNMAICDLRNVTLESAAEIESITNIAVLVYPKNPSPELSVALTKIPVKNVAATIYLEKDAPIAQRNGSCEISAKDFSSGDEIPFYDKKLVQIVAERSGLSAETVRREGEYSSASSLFTSVSSRGYSAYNAGQRENMALPDQINARSEERRVGKECGS